MRRVERHTKTPYTLEKIGIAVKEELEKSAVSGLQLDSTIPILSWHRNFFTKTEDYIWHTCMDLADVLCYLNARNLLQRVLPNTKEILAILFGFSRPKSSTLMKFPIADFS